MDSKIFMPVIVGPTASGKSSLGVEAALRIGGEIVCADSMQIYKGMSIATAKPTAEEMRGVPHHMTDIVDPSVRFSTAQYCTLAAECIRDIAGRGRVPILVGGTGLYVNALVFGYDFSDAKENLQLREELTRIALSGDSAALLEELKEVDPETAANTDINNTKRLVRALEYYRTNGKPISSQGRAGSENSPYSPCFIGLTADSRQYLYDRINSRVDKMFADGLLKEAEDFLLTHSETASQAIGYKELKPYFNGELSLEQATENLKRETRRYAKRQLTWFARNDRINWIKIDKTPQISEQTQRVLDIIREGN